MLKHTRKIKEIYEDIQRDIFYMIPEKWEKLFLYSSVIDIGKGKEGGELFFYYIPKGILKKKPINVYEIPSKFNLDENDYLKLVDNLYEKIKELREVFKSASSNDEIWSNVTITIQNFKFRVEYNYENLKKSDFSSYERHIIWRYNHLGIGLEQVNREEKEILKRYLMGAKKLVRKEIYDAGIYIKNVKNIVDYTTEDYDIDQNIEYATKEPKSVKKNQILLSKEEIEKLKSNQK